MSALELSSSHKKYLRGLAHELDPLVLVGKGGVSDGLLDNLDQALDSHELVKVKFNDWKDEKKELSAQLADRLDACQVGSIGNVAIFYRPARDEKKRHIQLPKGDRRGRRAAETGGE